MTELPKFLLEDSTPKDSPIFDAAEAWEEFEYQFRRNGMGLQLVINKAIHEHYSREPSPEETYQVQASFLAISMESYLNSLYPDFVVAINGLRRALDKLKGRAITWNHYQRGEVEDLALADFDSEGKNDMYSYVVKRAMSTYPEENGYLIDHQIGPDPYHIDLMGGYPMRLHVGYEASATNGLRLPLGEMFAIRETS